jgi:hypothetical protein
MDQQVFEPWTRRRFAVRGSLFSLLGLGLVERSEAKKKRKPKKLARCQADGTACRKKGQTCTASFCLHAPFRIEATWTNDGAQEAYLFVPAQNAGTDPGTYLNFACNTTTSPICGATYPFACIDEDQVGPGDGVTTVHKRLAGAYEYWIQLNPETDAGELTIVLRNKNGQVVQAWSSPTNPSDDVRGWHVFDIDGKRGSVTAIDDLAEQTLPRAAHDPFTFVCGS